MRQSTELYIHTLFYVKVDFGSRDRLRCPLLTWKPGHYFHAPLVCGIHASVHGGLWKNFSIFYVQADSDLVDVPVIMQRRRGVPQLNSPTALQTTSEILTHANPLCCEPEHRSCGTACSIDWKIGLRANCSFRLEFRFCKRLK